jgi:hypothetical protein
MKIMYAMIKCGRFSQKPEKVDLSYKIRYTMLKSKKYMSYKKSERMPPIIDVDFSLNLKSLI